MLFWISIIILLVGVGMYIWYDKFCSHRRRWIMELYNMLNALSFIPIIISVAVMLAFHIGVDARISRYEQTYKSLVYQHENNIFDWNRNMVGKQKLYNRIDEWNEDLAWYKSAQRDFWIGIYIPNMYDQFEFIELTPQND